jgi:plastocyanin
LARAGIGRRENVGETIGMRLRMTVAAMVAGLGIVAGLATAQQSVPTVTITASPTAASVDPAGPLAAGPTRLNVVRPAGFTKSVSAYVFLLVPGVTLEQLQKALVADDADEGESSLGLVSIQASVALDAGDAQRAVTFTVKPGLTYHVLIEQEVDKGTPPRSFTSFTSTGDPNGASAPAPAATVRLQGLRFHAPKTLKQTSTVRFENRDGVAHFALAFPLRKGTTTAQLGKAVKSERAFGRIAAGAPYMAQNVLDGGDTTNDQELHFPKKGTYGFVCFIDGHERLGMYKIITVR